MSDVDFRNIQLRVGELLFPLLSAFHQFGNAKLLSARTRCLDGSIDILLLDFGAKALVVSANADLDTIEFRAGESGATEPEGELSIADPVIWSPYIGKPFGWGWVTINQQGYCDGLLLSFEGIQPNILLNVMASEIKMCAVNK